MVMATRLEITENFAYKLADASRKQRRKLLKNASEEQLKGLFEICRAHQYLLLHG